MNLTHWAWLLLPLGVTRAMQIALFDRITDRPRDWLYAKTNPEGLPMSHPDRPYLSYLFECPWCFSVWVGALAAGLVAWDATRAGALWVLALLSLSLAAVVVDRAIDTLLPPQAHTTATLRRAGVTVEGPPEKAQEALDQLTGADHTGPG